MSNPPPATRPGDGDAGQALRVSETRYRRLFEAAQDGILLINAETSQIEDANPYLVQMLGFSHAELLGKKLWEVGAFVDTAKCEEMFALLQVEGYVRYHDLPLRTRADALVSVEFVSNAYDCAGVRVIQCNIRNLTEQRIAEDRVRQLSLVVEQSPVAIFIAKPSGEIEYVNAAALHNSGYGRDEVLGRHVRFLHVDAADARADIDATLALGMVWRGEFLCRRKDGSRFNESAVVAPIRRPDGSTSHHVTISEDITARKRDALELAQHRHRLEALVDSRTRELVVAMQAAEGANIAKSTFLTNMSHEIRTPLSAITGLAHLLRRTPLTVQQADWLGKLDMAGAHLLELINAILDLSKIDAGKLALEETDVNAGRIAANVVSLLADRAAARHLHLSVEMHPMPAGLVGDAARLQQALLNYAGNAVKFTDAGEVTLRVRCIEDGDERALVRFEVQDTGIGIAPEALPRLFKAFEQADAATTRRHGGTGLGLAIVRQLARLMGGDAGASSVPGAGSTFWFTAQLRKAPKAASAPAVGAGSVEARLVQAHAAARVQIVDDEPLNREVLLALLGSVFSDIDVAKDGREAVRLAGERAYALILMDVNMPGMGGLEATRRIRALAGGPATVIVAVTANAFAEDRAACAAAGMDEFVAKPFKVDKLFETILRGLSTGRRGPA